MTENEALKHIQSYAVTVDGMIGYCRDFETKTDITGYLEKKAVFDMATAALKEIQQYREIGTVEECREAVEKQKPKVPDYEGDGYADGYMVYDTWICPNCGKKYEVDYDDYKHCPECGQAIDDNLEGMEDV